MKNLFILSRLAICCAQTRVSASLVSKGLAETPGHPISFMDYPKTCWWPMMITVTICLVYLLIAY